MSQLSLKHLQVRDFILRYQDKHGEKPSLKVIADECGISKSTASEVVTALKGARELFGPVFQAKTARA